MEITAGALMEIRITQADVGKRVSVRRVETASGRSVTFTDTLGVLTSWTGGVLLITQKNGKSVRIAESLLVAGKVVPPAPARRKGPSATFEELSRSAARAWQPLESEALGGWTLRAAAGFTRRANSALPLGDPGMPVEEALARVTAWYARRGLPPYVQAATGALGTQELLCAELERLGWVREVSAQTRIAALAPIGDLDADVSGVELTRACDEEWLGRYGRTGALAPVARQVLSAGPSVWFAKVAGRAIGRCVVDGRWASFAAVEVDPAHRREGLATAVMTALARRALDEGASAAWLQVEDDNAGALALYDRLGFAPHHSYHHFRAR
ncbi:GNAT family N-acetyltransferase [Streptomyces sp. PvR034]|uniref:GNAT family N-acetyltransferase n=1 Tax=Streptomyces sp. PvR034 TaxID=3156401 RepID=UPI003390D3E6